MRHDHAAVVLTRVEMSCGLLSTIEMFPSLPTPKAATVAGAKRGSRCSKAASSAQLLRVAVAREIDIELVAVDISRSSDAVSRMAKLGLQTYELV